MTICFVLFSIWPVTYIWGLNVWGNVRGNSYSQINFFFFTFYMFYVCLFRYDFFFYCYSLLVFKMITFRRIKNTTWLNRTITNKIKVINLQHFKLHCGLKWYWTYTAEKKNVLLKHLELYLLVHQLASTVKTWGHLKETRSVVLYVHFATLPHATKRPKHFSWTRLKTLKFLPYKKF